MAWPNASAPGIAPTYYVDGIGFNGTPLLLSTSNSAVPTRVTLTGSNDTATVDHDPSRPRASRDLRRLRRRQYGSSASSIPEEF